MERATEISLLERALAHLKAGTTDTAPAQGRVSVRHYLDPEHLKRERDALFRPLPICVGTSHQVREAGDFFTVDVDEVPVLVSRDRTGSLGAFLNVCRHRGSRLVAEAAGRGRPSFTCPYHAWTYGNDGRLLGIPHEYGFPDVDRRTCGLVRLPVTEAHGLIFVIPSQAETGVTIQTYLGELGRDLAGLGIGELVPYESRTSRRRLNWKVALEIFLEAYHFRVAHATTIYPMFYDNLGLFDPLGDHLRAVYPKRTIAALARRERADWDIRGVANVLYVIFPNSIVLVEPDHVAMLSVYPEGPAESRLESRILIPRAPANDREVAYWQKNASILHAAIEEDLCLGESVQSTMSSGANEVMTFGRYEHALTYFHEVIRRTLAGAPPGSATAPRSEVIEAAPSDLGR